MSPALNVISIVTISKAIINKAIISKAIISKAIISKAIKSIVVVSIREGGRFCKSVYTSMVKSLILNCRPTKYWS